VMIMIMITMVMIESGFKDQSKKRVQRYPGQRNGSEKQENKVAPDEAVTELRVP